MLRSMTGFGRCFVEDARVSQQWEIRSVNSRYLDLKWRLPSLARYLETSLEKIVRRYAARGRVEITLTLQFAPGQSPKAAFASQQAGAMLDDLKNLALARGEEFTPDYCRFLTLPALWGEPEIYEMDDLTGLLEQGLVTALEDWNESRQAEGSLLGCDLNYRIEQMNAWAETIASAAPAIKEDKIQTLRERLAALLASGGVELEEDRFFQEIILLADRVDVSEELTRLKAHFVRMRQLLEDGTDSGRKLDFTLQECFREINTLGNKIQDAEISRIVVDFKNELEKCREQAQNLE